MVCDSTQEINNAEIKAITLALEVCYNTHKVTIVSDSLNAVRFAKTAANTSDRVRRKGCNANAKLILKQALQDREGRGMQTVFRHIRSHADDRAKKDRKKQRTENRTRFSNWKQAEEGNRGADLLASSAVGL